MLPSPSLERPSLRFFHGVQTDPLESIVIDPSEEFESVAERIGVGEDEQLRTSARREQYLKSFAQITTQTDLDLMLHSRRSETSYAEDGSLQVRIGSQRRRQHATDLSRKVFDLVCQEAVTIHEIGHVLYTDFDALNREVTAIESGYRALFFQLVNPLEDGAIEAQLRGRYNVDRELTTLYSNIAPTIMHGTSTEEHSFADYDGTLYTFHEATVQTLYDICTYDTGYSSRLLDADDEDFYFVADADRDRFEDLLPNLRSIVAEVLSEPDGDERMRLIGDFFRDVYRDYLDEASIAGVDQARNDQERDSRSTSRIGSDIDWSSISDSVAAAAQSEDIQRADRLPSEAELQEQLGDGESDDGDRDDTADEISSVAGSIEDRSAGGEQEDHSDDAGEGFEEEIEAEYRDEIRQEAADAADGMLDEAETMHGLLGGEEDLDDLQLIIERREQADPDRWATIREWGERLATILTRRLRRRRRTKPKTRQRAGSIDTRRLMDATRGYARIFEREEQPNRKDYSCLIVQDRSSSMMSVIGECENAVGSFAYALEDCGVDVSVVDFAYGTPRLTLPFGTPVADRRAELLSSVTGGGTPLSDVVALGRHRLDMVDGHPFMIVVTDDAPAHPDEYQDQLDHCNFPVIGVSLCPAGDPETIDHGEYFHRSKVVESMDDLVFDLEHLAREVIV